MTTPPVLAPVASPVAGPVAASIAAARDAAGGIVLASGVPAEPGWVRAADLADPGVMREWAEQVQAYVADRSGTPVGLDVAVSHGAGWYFRALAQALVAVWRTDGRVLDLSPETTYLRLVNPWADGVSIASPRFHCAASDPDAGHPDAVVADSEPALSARLRTEVTRHAQPVVEPMGRLGRIGRRTMWGLVTDGLVDAVSDFSASAPGRAEACDLLHGDVAPLLRDPDFRLLQPGGEPAWTRVNNSCCLSYKAGSPGALCATCPRIDDDAERTDLLHEQIEAIRRYEAEQALTA